MNSAGNAATAEALKRFDVDGDTIMMGGTKWYYKGDLPKNFNTLCRVVSVAGQVYRRAEGRSTFRPMEDGARIIRGSTSRFAKVVSHKLARNPVAQVVDDFEQTCGRNCLKASWHDLATKVGAVVQGKQEKLIDATPEPSEPVATVGIGVEGTCMLICDQKWREAVMGTPSLYDAKGERLHTVFTGAAPEYRKGTFFEPVETEIVRVKSLYPTMPY